MSYPEHEKLKALDGSNDTVGQFIDWLHGQGFRIAKYGDPYEVQVFVSCRNMGRGERRELETLIEERDPVAVGEWLDDMDYADEICTATPTGWGWDSFAERIALPDPADPHLPGWYLTYFNLDRLTEVYERTEAMIGRFFDIDPQKLSDEKDAMLAAIRAA